MRRTSPLILVLSCTLALLAGGCTDLGTTPYGELTEENYTVGERALPRAVAPVYEPLRELMTCCYSYVSMQSVSGDVYVKKIIGDLQGPQVPHHVHNWGPDHLYATVGWSRLYDGVRAANKVIHQVESGVLSVEESQQKRLLAEVEVARAFYYFHLMDNFGGVPIDTSYVATDLPPRSPREVVYGFVMRELNANIPHLPAAADLSTYGRFTKGAARTLLADLYLNAEVYTGAAHWDRVIDVTNEVIESGRYQLADEYADNFRRENHQSDELIFAIPYDEQRRPGNTFPMQTLTPEFQEAYELEVTPWGGGRAQPQFARSYEQADRRQEDTWFGGTLYGPQGDSLITFTATIPSLYSREPHYGWPATKYELYEGMGLSSDVDFPIYRYADVLMMKAEALLRTGRAAEAAELVTQVRRRAFADPADARVTGAELQEGSTINYGYWEDGEVVDPEGGAEIRYGRFLDELGWEFALEGHRRQDLIRFQTTSGESVFTAKSWFRKRASFSRPCETVFPIPAQALEKNPTLRQHECYR